MFNCKPPGGRPTLGGFQRIAWALLMPCLIQAAPVQAECSRQWMPEANLNVPRHGGGACVTPRGDIYVIGGRSGVPRTRAVERLAFDGTQYATSWQQLSPMPTPERDNFALACTSGFLYVIGGGSDSDPVLSTVYRYDVLNDSWSTDAIPAISVARGGAAAAVDGWGRIWVVGGWNVSNASEKSVEIFDPGRPSTQWAAGPSLNVARDSHGLVVDRRGTMWALGGSSNNSLLNSVESIDAGLSVLAGTWTTPVPAIPNPLSQTDYGVLGADGQIYIAGGWLPGFSSRVLRFDPMTALCETCTPMSQPMNHVRLVLGKNNRVFRIGGEPSIGYSSASVESLDTGQFCAASGTVPAVSGTGLAVFSIFILAAGAIVMRTRRLRTMVQE